MRIQLHFISVRAAHVGAVTCSIVIFPLTLLLTTPDLILLQVQVLPWSCDTVAALLHKFVFDLPDKLQQTSGRRLLGGRSSSSSTSRSSSGSSNSSGHAVCSTQS